MTPGFFTPRYFPHRLHGQHALLEEALADELAQPAPDERVLARIKKRKLQVKDRIRALEAREQTGGLHA
ncbi:DUF465 domain-containing protein [Brevundimonas sp. R86498]|uniref:DUF465 domain-containing protein n=1 Tax=Brevundimonas sp. R86498 TaxID=3093845 RepID=UPI0037CBDF8C